MQDSKYKRRCHFLLFGFVGKVRDDIAVWKKGLLLMKGEGQKWRAGGARLKLDGSLVLQGAARLNLYCAHNERKSARERKFLPNGLSLPSETPPSCLLMLLSAPLRKKQLLPESPPHGFISRELYYYLWHISKVSFVQLFFRTSPSPTKVMTLDLENDLLIALSRLKAQYVNVQLLTVC